MTTKHTCDECGESFDHRNYLMGHKAKEHKERDVECPVCGRLFATPNGMNCHRGKVHDNPWQDKSVLYRLHVSKNYSCPEIADKLNCSQSAVERHLREYGLQRYGRGERKNKRPPQHYFTKDGARVGLEYERIATDVNGTTKSAGVHQLVVIANGADPHKVFSNGMYHVHHKNRHGLDNRPENLELLSAGDHQKRHR